MLVIECLQEYFVIQMGAFTDLNNKGGVCQYIYYNTKKFPRKKTQNIHLYIPCLQINILYTREHYSSTSPK